MKRDRPTCKRCVLPESLPDIRLDPDGVCNICLEYEAAHQDYDAAPPLETDFTRIIEKHRGKHQYDCLVMCSGGKDSTSSLYYMVKRYKLNPLAFMFDHGFETEDAVANVRRAVESLDVNFLSFRSTEIQGLISKVLKSGSRAVICHLCSIWYMDLTFQMAARFDCPIIIAGWTKGQSSDAAVMSKCGCNIHAPEYRSMAMATVEFLETLSDDPAFRDFPRSMEEVLKRSRKLKPRAMVLSPHWFLEYDVSEYVETIQREIGWKYPRVSYPGESTNCYLNYIAVHNSLEYYGYTHYHVEMSKLIRQGLMTRDKALRLLEPNYDKDLLNRIAEPLDFVFP
jgi:hypothetical protein